MYFLAYENHFNPHPSMSVSLREREREREREGERERGGEREREREIHQWVAYHMGHDPGSNPQPRYVP